MDKNSVIFKIFVIGENNEHIEDKEYIFNLNEKIIDIKNKILKDTFKNKHNNLEMTNITEKVYKDYGKLFFDKGLLPLTINNYKLSEFTNGERTFLFLVNGSNIEKSIEKKNKIQDGSFIKKMIKEERKNNNEFKLFDDDFPPLSSSKK